MTTIVDVLGNTTAARHARAMQPAIAPLLGSAAETCSRLDLRGAPLPQKDWADSGGMALTGYREGPALGVRGHPASAVRASMAWLESLCGSHSLPGVELLGERAAMAGLFRNAPVSCGGAMRLLPCAHDHVAVSLARPADHALVPAIVEGDTGEDSWTALRRWTLERTAAEVADRCQLLGVPAAPAGPTGQQTARPWLSTQRGGPRRRLRERPRIVDLTSLWAGPLCARLLRLTGAEVTKIESQHRPDGARHGTPDFFTRMNDGSRYVSLDFTTREGRDQLHQLVADADVVLEASRPRALRHLGIDADELAATGTIWLSITARGRGSDWVGFGDDIAAGAGLLADSDEVLPAGDALADPLAGVHGAVAVTAALRTDRGWLLDLSMHETARLCARPANLPADHR
ncbi:hypothetical protein ASJ30_13430 [Janibacter indicus]|uniref:CoA-transferase family III n=1 Tax=Janibacter indicus TaxID=857417 RepID=A0A1L3MJ11_9MICO|nr:CoA transferase [Janibacter indicus]APH02407.1 hypothetical protein ASJ30_13430 [Janibacter indicus]